jgi:hypothetical protein
VRSAPPSSSVVIIAGCVSGAVVVVGAIFGFVWWKRRAPPAPPAKSVDASGDDAIVFQSDDAFMTKNPLKSAPARRDDKQRV